MFELTKYGKEELKKYMNDNGPILKLVENNDWAALTEAYNKKLNYLDGRDSLVARGMECLLMTLIYKCNIPILKYWPSDELPSYFLRNGKKFYEGKFNFEVPENIKVIRPFSLKTESLDRIILREGVERLDEFAFLTPSNNSEIYLPESLEVIGGPHACWNWGSVININYPIEDFKKKFEERIQVLDSNSDKVADFYIRANGEDYIGRWLF